MCKYIKKRKNLCEEHLQTYKKLVINANNAPLKYHTNRNCINQI